MIPFALPLALKAVPWKWLGIAVGALIVIGVVWWRIDAYGDSRENAGRDDVQQAWDKDVAERQRAYMALQADYRAREQAWAAQAAKARQERSNADARTIAGLERVVRGLRNRPDSPTVPGAAPSASDCPATCYGTGARLYRDHGAFLVREAARANRLRSALKECYSVSEGP